MTLNPALPKELEGRIIATATKRGVSVEELVSEALEHGVEYMSTMSDFTIRSLGSEFTTPNPLEFIEITQSLTPIIEAGTRQPLQADDINALIDAVRHERDTELDSTSKGDANA